LCNSCASLAGLVLSFIACFILLVIDPSTAVCAGDECCSYQLIDSSRERVVLETSRAIDDGTYRAVQLRVCSTEQVSVQLWRRLTSTSYQLHWQTTINPTARQTSLSHITVIFVAHSSITQQVQGDSVV